MTTRAPQPSTALAEAESLERLYGLLAPLHIGAGWAKPTQSLWAEPRRDHGAFDDRAARGRCDADPPHDRQQSPRRRRGQRLDRRERQAFQLAAPRTHSRRSRRAIPRQR